MKLQPEEGRLIIQKFGVTPHDDSLSEPGLARLLTDVIKEYLDKDLSKLLNILYRIDLKESEVKAILANSPPEEMAHSLALKVIEREKMKIESRKHFKRNRPLDNHP